MESALIAHRKELFMKRNEVEAEKLLKCYRYSRGHLKTEVDAFALVLPDSLQRFLECRYKQALTMEKTAEIMGYSLRNIYFFRKKLLKRWILFLNNI